MAFADTNVALRWLLKDDAAPAGRALALVHRSAAQSLLITPVVVAEIVYVLRGKGYDLDQLSAFFLLLAEEAAFEFEEAPVVRMTFEVMRRDAKLDFADCYLIARAAMEDRPLHTFDKRMLKMYSQVVAENAPAV